MERMLGMMVPGEPHSVPNEPACNLWTYLCWTLWQRGCWGMWGWWCLVKLCLYSLYSLNLPKLDSVTERMLGMVVPCEPLSVPNKQLCTLLTYPGWTLLRRGCWGWTWWCLLNLILFLLNQHVLFEPTHVWLCVGVDADSWRWCGALWTSVCTLWTSMYSLNLPRLDSVTERMLGMVVPC